MKNLTVSKAKPTKRITFYSLLEKYDGNIRLASTRELARVRPNGLKALFEAWRVYDQLNPKN